MAQPSVQQQAQRQLNPVIGAITKAAMRRARLSERAISGFTNSYAHQLGQINAAAPYGAAVGQQASVDEALRQSLSGAGTDLASQLAARLSALQGSSGQAAVDQTGGGLAARGSANANTEFAGGSSSLSQLLANQANASSYSKKLPGLAKLSGLQGIKSAEAQARSTIDQGTLQAESQLPSIVHEIQAMNQSAHQFSVSAGQRQEQIAIQQQNANTAAESVAQSAIRSDRSYQLELARIGIENQRAQTAALKQQILYQNNGLSPSEVSRYKSIAYSGANSAFESGTATYQQAMVEITQKGVPPSMAAKALASAGYKPGFRGAPKMPKPNIYSMGVHGPMGPAYRKAGGRPFVGGVDQSAYSTGAVSAASRGIVQMARQYIGTPYVWGGESPKGFDCSGFAQYLYGHAGIAIPRTTYTQWTASNGHSVPKGQLLPGDLVFYKGSDSITENGRVLPGHVGIYIGHGKIINAYGTGYGVRIDSVFSPSMGGYMGARRFGKG